MKIILTESQVIKLRENLITERPKKTKKTKNREKNGGERSVKERFLEDVKGEAGNILKQAGVGKEVVIVTGESTPDGDLVIEQCDFKAFAILEINGDVLTLELLLGEGVDKVQANKHYYLNIYNAISFNNNKPYIKLGVGVKGNIKNIKLNDFIMVSIYDAFDKNDEFIRHGVQRLEAAEAIENEEFNELSKQEADKKLEEKEAMDKDIMADKEKLSSKVENSIEKTKTEGKGKWDEQVKKIEQSMAFESSFLGMSNFFIYPKGYIAMDDILDKYGLGVHKDTGKEDFKIKINQPIYFDIEEQTKDEPKGTFPSSWTSSKRTPVLRGGNKPYGVKVDEDKGELEVIKPGDAQIRFDYILKMPPTFEFEKPRDEEGEEGEEKEKVTAQFLLRPEDNEVNNGNDYLLASDVVVEIIRNEK